MTFLDLCAGIGGFSIGLERAGMTCAGQVEIDPFCTRVLEKHWPHVPRWKDIKNEHEYSEYPAVDLVCGGYPCQPFSHAGKRQGAADDRHLWPYVFKIVQRLRPAWCLFENVAGHVTLGLDEVLADLESEAYTCQPLIIPACSVDAPHRRYRLWILAHSESGTGRSGLCLSKQARDGRGQSPNGGGEKRILPDANCERELQCEGFGTKERRRPSHICHENGILSHSRCERLKSGKKATGRQTRGISGGEDEGMVSNAKYHRLKGRNEEWKGAEAVMSSCWWPVEPDVGRVAYGVPRRVDKLKALGNAVVPVLVEQIGRSILAAHHSFSEDREG